MTRRRKASASFAACLCLSVLTAQGAMPQRAAAQATLVTGFGGPADFGAAQVPTSDDQGAVIDIMTAFPSGLNFFETTYIEVWVNTNGNITFGAELTEFTPNPFPIASRPMIAPFWGDVDTRGAVMMDPPGENRVFIHTDVGLIVVTWYLVGYYNSHIDLRNSFQLILTQAPAEAAGLFNIEFRYNRCDWTTGDASSGEGGLGGQEAQAGYDKGDLNNFLTLPGSLTPDVLDLCTTSNVGEPGVWRFSPRGTTIDATCGNGFRETGEQCDDANRDGGDGCDSDCRIEIPVDAGMPDAGMDAGIEDRPDTGPPVLEVLGGGCAVMGGGARGAWLAGLSLWVLALAARGRRRARAS